MMIASGTGTVSMIIVLQPFLGKSTTF